MIFRWVLVRVDSSEWASLTPRSLWEQLRGELRSYYGWELPSTAASAGGCPDEYLGSLRLLKCSLLRSICLKTGLQLLHREYALDNRARAPFTEDDILQVGASRWALPFGWSIGRANQ